MGKKGKPVFRRQDRVYSDVKRSSIDFFSFVNHVSREVCNPSL